MDPQGAAILAAMLIIVAAGGGLFAIIRLAILSAHDTAARRTVHVTPPPTIGPKGGAGDSGASRT